MGLHATGFADHDGTTQPSLDTSTGLVSASGGELVHPLAFSGPEMTVAPSTAGSVLREGSTGNPYGGPTPWASHPSGIGYTRQAYGGGAGLRPTQDSGTSNGSGSDELQRVSNFYGGKAENATTAQSAPTSGLG